MKSFLKKLTGFLLPIILLAFVLDFGISHNLKQSSKISGEFEVMNDIYNSDANSEMLIYGSSRAWVHIDPSILTDSLNMSSYNFGINGHNFWLQYLRHIEYLKHNEKPKVIILSVDIFSLAKRKDLYNADQFLPYMLWNKNIKKYTSSYTGYNKADYLIPSLRYFGKVKALKMSLEMFQEPKPHKIYRNRGFASQDKKWNSDLKNAIAEKGEFNFDADEESIDLFEQFIKECIKDDIRLVLVYTPVYIEGQNFISNREEAIDIFDSFATKYNLSFFNYSDDEICKNQDLFYNASHLNKEGAEIFSSKLAHDLKLDFEAQPLSQAN